MSHALDWIRGAPPSRTGSIRRALGVAGVAFTVVLAGVVVGFIHVNTSMREDLTAATTNLVEEQRIAYRLARAVTQQLVAASSFVGYGDTTFIHEFRSAGDDAYEEVRHYLFRRLTPEQRIQLEAIREEHQRLEVAASQAFQGFAAGRTADANESARAMVDHAMRLQAAVDRFMELREADLAELSSRQAQTFRNTSLGLGLVAVLLLLGIAFLTRFLHRRFGQPIAALARAATAIERGDFHARVEVPYDDEFAEVTQAFNRMADSLATAKSSLERRNQQLQDTLEELRTTQNELIQSEKMSATGRMMAGLAHELNNPLASVLGYAELLRDRLEDDEPPDAEELREVVDPILTEAVRARGLVRNLLRFSRRSEGEISAVPLRESLEVVVGLRAYTFEQAGLRLTVDRVPECFVRAEEQRLQQVFLNVINNAFDAMEQAGGGALRIRAHRSNGTVVVNFEDTGPGFEDPDHVFEPFYTTKAVGRGTGLGLSLVHRFMETFDGSVHAENRAEGGARMVLTFQTAEPERTAHEPRPPSRPAASSGVRVLVVEDEAPLRDLQRRILTRIDAEVLTAAASHEATRVLECEDVDLVVSDVKMPGGSGLELFRWVEANRPGLVDRFLFVTGDVGDPEIASFAEAEPDRFVHKPFQMAHYLERIVAALG